MSNFENELKGVFEGAEFSPSDELWSGIEAGLVKKRKKGIFFYWQTYGIAATIVFFVTLGFIYKGEFSPENLPPKKEVTGLVKEVEKTKEALGVYSIQDQKAIESKEIDKLFTEAKSTNSSVFDQNANQAEASSKVFSLDSDQQSHIPTYSLNEISITNTSEPYKALNSVSLITTLPKMPISISILKARWEAKNLLVLMPIETQLDEENEVVKGFLAINGGLGSGNFDPNTSGNALQANAQLLSENGGSPSTATNTVSNGQNLQTGAVTFGIGIDAFLSSKWSWNLGLSYSEYRFENSTNAYANESGKLLPVYLPTGYQGDLIFVPNYRITNNIISLALPIQLTYKLVELGDFDLDVSAGLSMDYFISNKVKGELSILEVRKVDFSQSNLFNRFNLGGLAGIGVSYKLNDQWGVNANIFARQYLKGMNDRTGYTSSPTIYGFGLNLRYFIRKEE